jgi:hypothetical protein
LQALNLGHQSSDLIWIAGMPLWHASHSTHRMICLELHLQALVFG